MLKGLDSVKKNLNAQKKEIEKLNIKALEKVGQHGVGIVKRNTPVDTGRLRASMGYSIDNKVKMSKGSETDRLKKNNSKKTLIIGTNVKYAEKVEYFAKNGSQGYMARSFMQLKRVLFKMMSDEYRRMLR